MSQIVKGQLVDIHNRRITPSEILIIDGKIVEVKTIDKAPDHFILPGFIDAHIHIESSMLVPSEFARVALKHGTVATVSDPHEIANVLGMEGVRYMIENGKESQLKFHFGAPSCVPATTFETSGATLDVKDTREMLMWPEIYYLSEMMNFPGVLMEDPSVLSKIETAHELGKPIDGHAPGLMGEKAEKYIAAGISTDHECFTIEEARDKLQHGMKIIIREGSAAKNFDALHPLIATHTDKVMFCSDDKHPDDLIKGHINQLVRRAVHLGYDLYDILQIACINPVLHYGLDVGILREGDAADFIIVEDLHSFSIKEVFVDGTCVVSKTISPKVSMKPQIVNFFNTEKKNPADFKKQSVDDMIKVIIAKDGELITEQEEFPISKLDEINQTNIEEDILKICVVNRYKQAPVAVGWIKNFGLRRGAIASSVAHDSHNIVCVGVDDQSLCKAVNLVIEHRGGLCAVNGQFESILPLPIAGLMSAEDADQVSEKYSLIDQQAKELGSTLHAPFMTLSFMALLVIPELKIGDLGLFDVNSFRLIDSAN